MLKYAAVLLGILVIIGLFAGCTGASVKYQTGDVIAPSNWSGSALGYCVVGYGEKSGDYVLQPVQLQSAGAWVKFQDTVLQQDPRAVVDQNYKKIDHTTCP